MNTCALSLLHRCQWVMALGLAISVALRMQAVDEASLSQLGVNVTGVNYYTTPFYANALWQGNGWLEYTGTNWGTAVATYGNAQFDAHGFPKYLNAGTKLRGIFFGLGTNYSNRPSTWPVRGTLALGKFVVTWQGDADIRLSGGTFISAESSGASTGRLVNGRRVYLQTSINSNITIEDINAANPITDIKVWMPNPSDPQNQTLEGQLFHPTAVSRISTGPWSWVRCMDWNVTNASPQQDWSDRRLPSYVFQTGVLNPRIPATGFAGNRGTGVAFEHMVAFCNAVNKDMWITVPHLATTDFITKLAQLIAFGSDGVNPYTSPQASPVYAPLNSNLRLFVEYSNEIWSSGNSFPQGNWAQDQATAAGISKAQFNARRFCTTWATFQSVFGSAARLVKVAAVFTGNQTYTQDFLNEIRTYGATLSPAQEPDLIAPTTYFGNGIQDWAYARAQTQAGTSDPWFLTSSTFDSGGGVMRPVSVASTDGYWTSSAITNHLSQTFDQWKRLMLSGATQTGGGPDATGIGGGFDVWMRNLALTTFSSRKPLVTYEGGPSLYSDYLDGGDARDDGITTFLELLNRQPQMAEVYRIHLNMAKAKGLRTHGAFVDSGSWGKYGQWGHLEYLDQTPATSPKWSFLLDWQTDMSTLRHIDDVAGTAPQFVTAAKLSSALWGQSYSASITTTGGENGRTIQNIGQVVANGISTTVGAGTATISGTPGITGDSFVYLRVCDGDGDPAWRTFYFKTVGGPRVLVESNFEGTNPSSTRPWTPTYVKAVGYTFTGWNKGTGISAATGNDALVYSQNMPAAEVDSTLAAAITANEYWTSSLQPPSGQTMNLRGAEVRFTIRRIDYHAPRQYAAFNSIGGFTAGSEVFTTARFTSTVDQEFVFTLPDSAAYEGLTNAVEFRLVGFSGQYAGHKTSISGFKVTSKATAFDTWTESAFTPAQQTAASITGPLDDPDGDGIPNLMEWAFALPPSQGGPANTAAVLFEGNVVFNYVRSVPALNAGTLFTVEWSDNLAANGWSSSGVTQQVLSDNGTVQQVKATVPAGTAGRRFVHLKVTAPSL
ncbi:MAG: hypothetical protein JNM99_11940 [Verrucomicrobiaceae bacterium]|nr:hypothetical protein [Verrucomicrobiaceae bacterium]